MQFIGLRILVPQEPLDLQLTGCDQQHQMVHQIILNWQRKQEGIMQCNNYKCTREEAMGIWLRWGGRVGGQMFIRLFTGVTVRSYIAMSASIRP